MPEKCPECGKKMPPAPIRYCSEEEQYEHPAPAPDAEPYWAIEQDGILDHTSLSTSREDCIENDIDRETNMRRIARPLTRQLTWPEREAEGCRLVRVSITKGVDHDT